MVLSAWLLRHTPPRPLIVSVPGGTEVRLAVERVVRERGWQSAVSPAEANIVVVAGVPGPALETYVQQVRDLVPAPRAYVDIVGPADVRHKLDTAVRGLRDVDQQRHEAARSTVDNAEHAEHQPRHDMTPPEHDHSAHSDGHTAHETHEGHGDHAHHMGGMDMPGGVPMADRADDRDGLKLDQLHVPLGPVLPLWPAGLIVHTRLQGDVIQQATVELVDAGRGSFWRTPAGNPEPDPPLARRLDSSARLLALAGWTDAAMTAQRLRDAVLDGGPATDLLPRLHKWTRRVHRSRTLRWLLAGVGSIPDDPTTPAPLAGDALDRLRRWLEPVSDESLPDQHETQWTVDNLPTLLEGTELATARLVVASLDPDLDLLAHRAAHHG